LDKYPSILAGISALCRGFFSVQRQITPLWNGIFRAGGVIQMQRRRLLRLIDSYKKLHMARANKVAALSS
jgi:hypothetical protein